MTSVEMKDMKVINECVECGGVWQVYDSPHLHYCDVDVENFLKYGQIYSVCENCNNGICKSVIK